jgi:plastocyanin domain-containing protein
VSPGGVLVVWTADRLAVVGVCAVLLVAIYVFFFGRRKAVLAAAGRSGGAQTVTVVVQGGYKPDLIVARRGVPLTLVFDRREESPCSDEIVLPDFGIRRALPAHQKTEISLVPERAGDFEFTCGMNMLHGKILVE